MDFNALQRFLEARGQRPYRLQQVKEAYTRQLVESWEGVTAWPKTLRDAAEASIPWDCFTCDRIQESKKKDTVKFLLIARADQAKIETVIMRHADGRNTVCISSQVGCPMGCAFCATGMMGLKRNLTAAEIFEQVIHAARWLKDVSHVSPAQEGEPRNTVTNVVYMGMGEPMHNYDAVMESVRMLNDAHGFGLGVRHISISTCGIVPGILRLTKEPERVNLAISLHSAVPETRSKIMPVNRAYPLDKLMKAVEQYVDTTNRKVLFEYLLIKGVNDTEEEAGALINLLKKRPKLYHANLIKYHDTGVFTSTPSEERKAFLDRLLQTKGVLATLRHSFGEDIDAACGQLATKSIKKEQNTGF